MSHLPSTLSKPRPFALGKVPLQVSESEFNICCAFVVLPLVLSILLNLVSGYFFNPLISIGVGVVLGAIAAVFFTIVKRGKPDSYLYDYAHRSRFFAFLIQPKRGSLLGRKKLIAAVEPGIIVKPWGGMHDTGPRTEEELMFPEDGRGGALPRALSHPAEAGSSLLLLDNEDADRG